MPSEYIPTILYSFVLFCRLIVEEKSYPVAIIRLVEKMAKKLYSCLGNNGVLDQFGDHFGGLEAC